MCSGAHGQLSWINIKQQKCLPGWLEEKGIQSFWWKNTDEVPLNSSWQQGRHLYSNWPPKRQLGQHVQCWHLLPIVHTGNNIAVQQKTSVLIDLKVQQKTIARQLLNLALEGRRFFFPDTSMDLNHLVRHSSLNIHHLQLVHRTIQWHFALENTWFLYTLFKRTTHLIYLAQFLQSI